MISYEEENGQQPEPRRIYNDRTDIGSEALSSHARVKEIHEDLALMNTSALVLQNKMIKGQIKLRRIALTMASLIPHPPAQTRMLFYLDLGPELAAMASRSGNEGQTLKAVLKTFESGQEADAEDAALESLGEKTKKKLLTKRSEEEK